MMGYTTGEVSEVVGLAPAKVRSYARSGLLAPRRGSRNEYRFSFQDIVLLRVARELAEQRIPPRRIRSALFSLRMQLPEGRPLSAVSIAAAGEQVVVRDRHTVWEPESGQIAFDFAVEELAERAAAMLEAHASAGDATNALPDPGASTSGASSMSATDEMADLDADDWYDLGIDLEAVSVRQAEAAYREALARDPTHAEAHLNVGRLLQERGQLTEAIEHYRAVLTGPTGPEGSLGRSPVEATRALALFNLGVALEDSGEVAGAMDAYRSAVELDEELAGAHFNLARLSEGAGDESGAVRHLAAYRRLKEQAGYRS